MTTFGEDRERAFSLKGSVVDLAQSLAIRPDAKAATKSATSIEAEVETAMAALRRIRTEKTALQDAFERQHDEIDGLRQLVAELRTYKDDAKRELAAAARMLTAEQERATILERNLRTSEAHARRIEEWNAMLRGHLDSLIASIVAEEPIHMADENRQASA